MVFLLSVFARLWNRKEESHEPCSPEKERWAAVGKDSDSFAGTSLPAAHSPANGLAQVEKTIAGDQQKALACVVAATELGPHIVAMESQSPTDFWKCWFARCENDPVVGERCLAS